MPNWVNQYINDLSLMLICIPLPVFCHVCVCCCACVLPCVCVLLCMCVAVCVCCCAFVCMSVCMSNSTIGCSDMIQLIMAVIIYT